MSHLLNRLGQACARHPWRTLAGWVGAVIVIVVLAGSVGGEPVDNFRLDNSESQRAHDTLTQGFEAESGSSAYLVVHDRDGA